MNSFNGFECVKCSFLQINVRTFIVDQEIYLHTEENPRYRGAAIPSKAFKMLQHMTDGNNCDNNNGMYNEMLCQLFACVFK